MRRDSAVLGWLAWAFNWMDDFIILISGPMLAFGLGLAAVDLFTGGRFLEANPNLVTVWAICQAVGVTGQLLSSAGGVRRSLRSRQFLAALGFAIMTAILAYVEFLAAQAFTLHEAFNASVGQALAFIGIDATSWAFQRAGVAVGLVVLAGLTRYIAEQESEAEETARLEREARMAPLRGKAFGAKIDAIKDNAARLNPVAKKGAPAPATTPLEAEQSPEDPSQETGAKVVRFRAPKSAEKKATQWIYTDVVTYMAGPDYRLTITPEKAKDIIKDALKRARKPMQYLQIQGGPLWADVRTVKTHILAVYGPPGQERAEA